jgi:hypothetical protein
MAGFPSRISPHSKQRLESELEVPDGRWFKRFDKFTLAGEGELPKTFLTPGMAPTGQEVH